MSLKWKHENPPHWDAGKEAIVGGAAPGVFDLGPQTAGGLVAGEWWRVEDDRDRVVGYGWMDTTWGDGEILLAVAPEQQGAGVGSFILTHLEQEAASRGLNYLYNVVRPSHPERARITSWLTKRGFAPSHDDDRLTRQVRRTEPT